jgi:hypothetical protein
MRASKGPEAAPAKRQLSTLPLALHIRHFKKMANHELGQRHGIESGLKLRADPFGYGSLVATFVYGISNVRKRIDKSYGGVPPEEVAQRIVKAAPLVPYP